MLTVEDILEAKRALESGLPEPQLWLMTEQQLYAFNVHLGALGQPKLYFGDTCNTPYGPKIITEIHKL